MEDLLILVVCAAVVYFIHRYQTKHRRDARAGIVSKYGLSKYPKISSVRKLMKKVRDASFVDVKRITMARRSEETDRELPFAVADILRVEDAPSRSTRSSLGVAALSASPVGSTLRDKYFDRYMVAEYSDGTFDVVSTLMNARENEIKEFYKDALGSGVEVYDVDALHI